MRAKAMQYYGVCDCQKWGMAPKAFDERFHFMKCPSCNKLMYLDPHDPKEAGYRDSDIVVPLVVKQ